MKGKCGNSIEKVTLDHNYREFQIWCTFKFYVIKVKKTLPPFSLKKKSYVRKIKSYSINFRDVHEFCSIKIYVHKKLTGPLLELMSQSIMAFFTSLLEQNICF